MWIHMCYIKLYFNMLSSKQYTAAGDINNSDWLHVNAAA